MHSALHRLMIGRALPQRMAFLAQVRERQGWGWPRIKAWQEERLRETIAYCWQHVPFYRQHWAGVLQDPRDIQRLEDLAQLPILTKALLREHAAALCSTEAGLASSEARTGGSTGQPIIFRMTPADEQWSWAQMYGGWEWAGWQVGDPFLVVGGESVGIGLGDRRTRKDRVMNRWATSGSNLTLERTQALVRMPHFHQVRLIYGYPNSIRELCEFLAQLGERPRALRGVVCTAEVMRPEVRQRIAEVLGTERVLDQWGMNDGGMHACERHPGLGLHLSFHRGVLEVVDEAGAQVWATGQPGRALATSLSNPAMPLVRYETGDQIHWQDFGPGADGVAWPRIGPVDGRTGDVIALPSGRKIPMPGLTLVMRWMEGLKSYQFIQTAADAVTVRLDRDAGFTLDEAQVREFLRQRIALEVQWTVVWGAPEMTRNGKLLIIRNDWARGALAPAGAARQDTNGLL